MLKAMSVMNKTRNLYTVFLLLAVLTLCPLTAALSQEAPKVEGENTLGDGLKVINEAKSSKEVQDNNEEMGGDEDAQSKNDEGGTQTDDSSQAEVLGEAEPGNEAQDDKTNVGSQNDRANTSAKEGLPRGDMLRNAQKPRYDSTGMRDPFKPFIKLVDIPKGPLPIVRPPIRRYPLSSFRLAGIIWIGDEPKAMIVDPETNTYFLGVGDKIGNKDGEILEVRERGILVQEKTRLENVYGEVKIEVKKSVLAFQN